MKEHINQELAEQIKTLNDLLGRCYDAAAGYENAAEHVKDQTLKTLLAEMSAQRKKFCSQLEWEVSKLGGKPQTGSSLAGNIHRTWMSLKSAVATNDKKAILEECLRGERIAFEQYEEVLDAVKLPNDARLTVSHQYNQIEQALKKLSALQ